MAQTTKKKTTNAPKTTTKKNTAKKSTSTKSQTKKTQTKKTTKSVTKKQPVKKEIKVVEQPPKEETQKITLKRVYIIIIIILSILLLISSTIEIINMFTPSENLLPQTPAEKPTITESELDKLNALFSEDIDLSIPRKENNNNEIVGRIEIPGVFNLLLTQTKDNDYYIEYNIKKKRSNKGTEFIDYRNKFTDKQINIYGHNSRLYDLPFKKLENFLDKEFFDNNEYILFQHDKGRRIYQIAAIKKVTTDYEHMIVDAKDQKQHIEKLLENPIQSRQLEYNENTNIIVLQTCIRQEDGNYYILIGYEVK